MRKSTRHPKSTQIQEKTRAGISQANGNNGCYAYTNGRPVEEVGDLEAQDSNLQSFYTKNIFTCEGDGRPVWCSTCLHFKQDSEFSVDSL